MTDIIILVVHLHFSFDDLIPAARVENKSALPFPSKEEIIGGRFLWIREQKIIESWDVNLMKMWHDFKDYQDLYEVKDNGIGKGREHASNILLLQKEKVLWKVHGLFHRR